MKPFRMITAMLFVILFALSGCSTPDQKPVGISPASTTQPGVNPTPTKIPTPEPTVTPTPIYSATPTPSPLPTATPAPTPDIPLTVGKVTGNTYTNAYFGITLKKPKAWYFDTTDQFKGSSADLAKQDGFFCFLLSNYPKDSKKGGKASIYLYCIKIQGTEYENDSPVTYLQHSMGQKATAVKINGVDFAAGAEFDRTVKWDYCTIKNGYALYFTLNGIGKLHEEVQQVFETIIIK